MEFAHGDSNDPLATIELVPCWSGGRHVASARQPWRSPRTNLYFDVIIKYIKMSERRWGGTVPSLISRMGQEQDDSNFYLVEEGWDQPIFCLV